MSEEKRCFCKCCSRACRCNSCTDQVPKQNKEIALLKEQSELHWQHELNRIEERRMFLEKIKIYRNALENIKQYQSRVAGVGFEKFSVTIKLAEEALKD